jgi:asparagine synthase (glutamine-hydrolysing)
MCGITGIVNQDRAKPVEAQLIERMCDVIHHRGPDEWGMWCDGPVGIGMKRLCIIDLAGGRQPIANADGTIRIVFNGEIYNFQDLRDQLIGQGYRFVTRSDTETILHAYEAYGEDCVQYLRGMFAFAIWDGNKQKLFLARDRFGKKPLHYLHDGTKLVFGSEIKSILVHPEIGPEVNRAAIVDYLAYGYVPDPDTMFNGIAKLPPGHTLSWQNGNINIQQYWDLNFQPDAGLSQEEGYYLDKVDQLLHEAVKIRLISDVPLGAFLSGGIDSSLVVAMMARQTSAPVKTFSIGFDEGQYNELPYARLVADRYGTDHHEEIIKPDADEVISDLVRAFDEPFADSSAIPTYYVSRLARRHVTVALSGDGGDELFAGYDRYLDSRICQQLDEIPKLARHTVLGNMAKIMPEGFYGVNTLRYLAADADDRYVIKMTGGLSSIYKQVFSDDLVEATGDANPSAAVMTFLKHMQGQDMVTRRQYADVKRYLAGDILTKVDRTSMLVSLEARAPLLDHQLAEFAAKLPLQLKVKARVLKNVLKTLARKYLPESLIDRPKMGFALPVAQWINQEWRDMSQELVVGRRALERHNFNPRYLNRILAEHRRGRRDHSRMIWTLMVLEMWYRTFIDRPLET